MSMVTSYSTQIRLRTHPDQKIEETPGWLILVEAMEATARAHEGCIARSISDSYGRIRHLDLALMTPEFPRGIGVYVDRATGEVSYYFDDHGDRDTVMTLAGEICQNFSVLALTRAFAALNYSVELEEYLEGDNKQVLIRGNM